VLRGEVRGAAREDAREDDPAALGSPPGSSAGSE
jgi:hypothetical protein